MNPQGEKKLLKVVLNFSCEFKLEVLRVKSKCCEAIWLKRDNFVNKESE